MTNSAQQALKQIFEPQSVAIIGLSRSAVGSPVSVLTTLQDYGYRGNIYIVNPNMRVPVDAGYEVYREVRDLPAGVDLAVVSVARESLLEVLKNCVAADIFTAIVITQGLADADEVGAQIQQNTIDYCQQSGLRVLGPNTIGVANAHHRFTSSFIEVHHDRTPIGLISQSGLFMMGHLLINNEPAGFSMSADLGNACDLDLSDVLEYYGHEDNIRVIACHVEGIRDGRSFIDTARSVAQKKPIVLLKAGNSESGQLAVASHSGAVAGETAIYQAAFDKAGVITVNSAEELRQLAKAFATYQLPRGNRVAIMSFSGGGAILAIDAVEAAGLSLAKFSQSTCAKLQPLFPSWMEVTNPLDIWIGVSQDFHATFPDVLEAILIDDQVDAVICIYCSYTLPKYEQYDSSLYIADLAEKFPAKPILNWTYGMDIAGFSRRIENRGNTMVFRSLPEAAHTLARMNAYREFCETVEFLPDEASLSSVDDDRAREILQHAAQANKRYLFTESLSLLSAYGITVSNARVVKSEDTLYEICSELNFPVCLKIVSPDLPHKSDVGGVVLDVRDLDALNDCYQAILASVRSNAPNAGIEGVLVQEMAPSGKELMIGAKRDPVFGHCLVLGAGGIYAEVIDDFAFRLAPASRLEATQMLDELRCAPILRGVRGEQPCFHDGVVDVLLRVSKLVHRYPQIREIDINPLIVTESEVIAVDARVFLD
ncbi:MAG: acetate--CoA ligase family protein [Arenicellales bacterium]|jgi:acetyltransferase|nr:acetate--CoA ligase family protein [Arenicellales bacterium]